MSPITAGRHEIYVEARFIEEDFCIEGLAQYFRYHLRLEEEQPNVI